MLLPPLSPKILPFDWQSDASAELVSRLTTPVYDRKECYTEVITRKIVGDKVVEDIRTVKDADILTEKWTQNGVLLRAGTGTGKMYMACAALRVMLEKNLLTKPEGSVNPFYVLWLTPKSVKSQTMLVVNQYGLTPYVHVMSYSEIKTSLGAMYVTWVELPSGPMPIWNPQMLPALVKCDECQVLKNPKSQQSAVVRAIPAFVKSIFASATPFQRCEDATTLLERFQVRTKYNPVVPASPETSGRILKWIADPKKPSAYAPSAVERLREELTPYIVELKNVRFKFPAHTKCVSILFKDEKEKAAYDKIVAKLIENLNKRKARDELSAIHFLVEMQKMQQGAEILRVPHICDRVVLNMDKKAVIVASNFVDTLLCVRRMLIERRGVAENRIALVMGGQDQETRAAMVRDFQTGKRDILLFTMKSGGVGISLHHDRESTKPRHIILPPTWSAIDLVQALGRGHRLTSLSATTQEILWYANTIEDAVKIRVELKIKCLSKAVTAKEQFVDTFVEQIGERLDADEVAEAQAESEHANADDTSDDLSSSDDSDSLTGEGLDEEDRMERLQLTN